MNNNLLNIDIQEGACCTICKVKFDGEHGYPVICIDCWNNLFPEERVDYNKAYLNEM